MTDAEIQRWCRLAYLRFYYRPQYIARAIRRLQSQMNWRSVKTAWQMLWTDPGANGDSAGMEVLA